MEAKETEKNKKPCWVVDLRAHGKGRIFAKTKALVLEKAKVELDRIRDYGESIDVLPREKIIVYIALENDLKAAGATLRQAVEFYLHHNQADSPRELQAGIVEFLEAKKRAGKRPRYLESLKSSLGMFARSRGQKLCSEVTRADVEGWLHESGFAPSTIRGYLIDLKTFFGFGMKRGWLRRSPCDGVEPILDDGKPPEIFTVEQIKRLFHVALHGVKKQRLSKSGAKLSSFDPAPDPTMIAYLALAIFCGIRPDEIHRMTWKNVDIEAGHAEVPAAKSKTRKRRLVHLSDNCKAWLRYGLALGAEIPVVNFTRKIMRLKVGAGLVPWPQDVLRHCFASYHLAMHGSADKTAHEMGHASTKMLYEHYRELVPKKEAEAFWLIMPPKKGI